MFFRVFYALHRPDRTVVVALVTLLSLVAFLSLVPKGAFVLVPLCLSAAFTIAAFLLAGFLVPILGREALPGPDQLVRWLASAALGAVAWKLVSWRQGQDAAAQLAPVAAFLCAYAVSVGILLPDFRRTTLTVLREAASHAGRWRR